MVNPSASTTFLRSCSQLSDRRFKFSRQSSLPRLPFSPRLIGHAARTHGGINKIGSIGRLGAHSFLLAALFVNDTQQSVARAATLDQY